MIPASFQSWFDDGADDDAFETPVFTDHIRSLKGGKAVTSPLDGSRIEPAKYVVVDAPLGRVHRDSGKHIDFMVFVDTPLDIAMARRLTREFGLENEETSADTIAGIKADLDGYLNGARLIYKAFVDRVRPTCDLVLDGCLSLDELASVVVLELSR